MIEGATTMMKRRLGQKMLDDKVVTKAQIREALGRQRLHGGRLGQNLLSLGYISEDQLETFLKRTPQAPETVEETGLELEFIADLTLKHVMNMGPFRLSDLSLRMGLPSAILDEAIELLRRENLVEVRSATQFVKSSFNFIVTDLGKVRGNELMEICRYVGPTPVILEDYRTMVENQSIQNIMVDDATVSRAFSEIVISDHLLKRLGPAISSGTPMFMYGPPGNGKTTISETIGQVLPETVYIPYALFVGGQIINIFDPVNHIAIDKNGYGEKPDETSVDQRWVLIRRPVVITGGELTLRMLDLEFNSIAKFYEAPLQMKANNGLFLVDDFGRQQMDPQNLLNRWIVNLDRQIDFMSMHTGMKFEIPFDQLVIFATNLEPKTLVDEAFLRRIRYKIKIDHPNESEFEEIFRRVCRMNAITFEPDIFEYLIEHWYRRLDRPLNACHPRDLVNHIIDTSRYHNKPPELTRDAIDLACENYFVEM
jgi:predicted ATPase with chaperone activity